MFTGIYLYVVQDSKISVCCLLSWNYFYFNSCCKRWEDNVKIMKALWKAKTGYLHAYRLYINNSYCKKVSKDICVLKLFVKNGDL